MSRRSRSLQALATALVVAASAGCSSSHSVRTSQTPPPGSTSTAEAQDGPAAHGSIPPSAGSSTTSCDKLQFDVSDVQESYTTLLEDIPPGTLNYQAKDIDAVSAADAVAAATATGGGYPKVAAAFMALSKTVQARGSLADFQNAMLAAVQPYNNACFNLQGAFGESG